MRSHLQETGASRDDEADSLPEPANLRFLRRLVTGLMATMIVGIAVVAGALVYGVTASRNAAPQLLGEIRIEPGLRVVETAFRAPDRVGVVLRDASGRELLRIYRLSGDGAPVLENSANEP